MPQAGIDRGQINGLAVKAFRREADFAAGLLNNVDQGRYLHSAFALDQSVSPALSFDIDPKPPPVCPVGLGCVTSRSHTPEGYGWVRAPGKSNRAVS